MTNNPFIPYNNNNIMDPNYNGADCYSSGSDINHDYYSNNNNAHHATTKNNHHGTTCMTKNPFAMDGGSGCGCPPNNNNNNDATTIMTEFLQQCKQQQQQQQQQEKQYHCHYLSSQQQQQTFHPPPPPPPFIQQQPPQQQQQQHPFYLNHYQQNRFEQQQQQQQRAKTASMVVSSSMRPSVTNNTGTTTNYSSFLPTGHSSTTSAQPPTTTTMTGQQPYYNYDHRNVAYQQQQQPPPLCPPPPPPGASGDYSFCPYTTVLNHHHHPKPPPGHRTQTTQREPKSSDMTTTASRPKKKNARKQNYNNTKSNNNNNAIDGHNNPHNFSDKLHGSSNNSNTTPGMRTHIANNNNNNNNNPVNVPSSTPSAAPPPSLIRDDNYKQNHSGSCDNKNKENNNNNDSNSHSNNNGNDKKNDTHNTTTTATVYRTRSGRQTKSTVIRVKGGHTVKKENNYVLKGDTYQHGVAVDETTTKKPPKKKQPPKKPKPVENNKPRVVSQAEQDRVRFKKFVEAQLQAKQSKREQFLVRHTKILEPFLESKVLVKLQQLQQKQQSNTTTITKDSKKMYMQPDAIQADLRDYQLDGLNWMANMHSQNMGMILGDEMGLGKTLQTISLICHLKEKHPKEKVPPSLVVCPLSVLYSWCTEIQKWAPSLKHLRFHSSNPESLQHPNFGNYDIVVTTYEMIKSKGLWGGHSFHLCVLDEGHKIKGHETQIARAVRRIRSENRLILTGTPLANNLVELWSLLNFLVPDILTTPQPFAEAFDLLSSQKIVADSTKLNQSHALLKAFMIRRLKSEVEQLMPSKIETKIVCPLSTTQIWWYKAILLKDIGSLAAAAAAAAEEDNSGGDNDENNQSNTTTGNKLNNIIMQLRKCCLHPYLFPGAEDTDKKTALVDLIGDSGKLAVLDKLLRSLYKKKHRVVLFSQFTSVLDILDDYCSERGWKYCRFDGGTCRAKRNYVVNSFNAPQSHKFLFLMSTRSGGMGLNLQTADTCILFDSDWNPQPDIQAMARVHRIGQTKTVHVYRLVTEGTVEARMVERQEKKLFLDRVVTRDGVSSSDDPDTADNNNNSEQEEEGGKLLATLKFGCDAVFGANSNNHSLPTDEDIELITDRNRTEDFSNGKLKGGTVSNAKDFDVTKKLSATQTFGGVDFQEIRKTHSKKRVGKDMGAIGDLFRKQRRRRKSRIKMVASEGSGYGQACVPVLVSNDYDLEEGERSVFDVELGQKQKDAAAVAKKKTKKEPDFVNQDFCQVCGGGGLLICCPRCPISLHFECAGIKHEKEFAWCSHHKCTHCGKNNADAGGFLFPCSCCPNSYCEDCLPKGARFLETCDRMEELNYELKHGVYVHCSPQCEQVAIQEFGWSLKKEEQAPCPEPIDVSSCFNGEVDDCDDNPTQDLIVHSKRRRKQVNYNVMEIGRQSGTSPTTGRSTANSPTTIMPLVSSPSVASSSGGGTSHCSSHQDSPRDCGDDDDDDEDSCPQTLKDCANDNNDDDEGIISCYTVSNKIVNDSKTAVTRINLDINSKWV